MMKVLVWGKREEWQPLVFVRISSFLKRGSQSSCCQKRKRNNFLLRCVMLARLQYICPLHTRQEVHNLSAGWLLVLKKCGEGGGGLGDGVRGCLTPWQQQ